MLRFSRLRTRRDFLQETTYAHPPDFFCGDRTTCEYSLQHEIEAIGLWRSCATGQSNRGNAIQVGQQQQIARIDGHPNAQDLSAGGCYGRWNDVTPVRK